ncbi:MAG: metallophosphoesterase family protein [Burkholderiaceae bacterium]
MPAPVLAVANDKADTASQSVRFALFADNPYSDKAEKQVAQALQRAAPGASFFIHVGDIKGGGERCDDGLLLRRLALLKDAPRPMLLTPGDNEWTDCHRIVAGNFDPLERLQWLRREVFAEQRSLGQPALSVQNQTAGGLLPSPLAVGDIDRLGLPENQQWQMGPCQFVSLSVTGSAHGFRSGIDEQFIAAHARANQRWLSHALNLAIENERSVLVVVCHAEFGPAKLSAQDSQTDALNRMQPYAWLRSALHQTVVQFPGTVLLLNGDTHVFALDQPWARQVRSGSAASLPTYGVDQASAQSRMKRFTRIRGIGAPAASAFVSIEISQPVDPDAPIDLTVTPYLF